MVASQFTKIDREGFPVWMHNEKPVWIVYYERTGRYPSFYQAYKSVHAPKKGQMPWAVDNRALRGKDHEFRTLREAMKAAEAA